jgi:transcriptional regulator GlxA family with amidase domain
MIPPKGTTIHDPRAKRPFELYTVSDTKHPIRASGGMQIIPDYTFDDAPQPNIVVIPAQSGNSPKMMDWIRTMATRSEVVMSVCTGAFTLAQTGLLNGKAATTHHDAWETLHRQFPLVTVRPNMRYVQSDPVIFTSGGLSAGIDLALHIVELYFGREVAETRAYTMEYEAKGWKRGGASSVKYTDGMAAMNMK